VEEGSMPSASCSSRDTAGGTEGDAWAGEGTDDADSDDDVESDRTNEGARRNAEGEDERCSGGGLGEARWR
jgi:hypothetical protein